MTGTKRVIIAGALIITFAGKTDSQTLSSKVEATMNYAESQLGRSALTISRTKYPRRNYEGYRWESMDKNDWTSGFWPGCLWLAYEWTQNNAWLDKAQKWTAGLESIKYDRTNHDVGFQMMCSFGNGYRLTAPSRYRDIIVQAAQSLASRFDTLAGSIISWDKAPWHPFNRPVIIDNIMNLELLFYATRLSGDSIFHKLAVKHAEKTLITHQRANGTFYHVVDYDDQGDIIYKGFNTTDIFLDPEETWARGQGWALYGFVMCYRYSGNSKFLTAAEELAEYLMTNLPADYIPYFLLNYPLEKNSNRDASAGAIMASGLLELYGITQQTDYLQLAENILASLLSPAYLTQGKSYYSILNSSTETYTDQEKGLIYADYYFMEAMARYKKLFPATTDIIANTDKKFSVGTNSIYLSTSCRAVIRICDLQGRNVYQSSNLTLSKGYNYFPFRNFVHKGGVYIVQLKIDQGDFEIAKLYLP